MVSSDVTSAWQTLDGHIACLFFTLSTWPTQIQKCLFVLDGKENLVFKSWMDITCNSMCLQYAQDKCQQPANECHFNSLMHGKCLKAVLPLLWLFGMTSNLHISPQNSRKHTFCVKFQIMAQCSCLLWASSYQWDGPVAGMLVPL